MRFLFLLGRIIFGGYFLYNGINHFLSYRMMAGYAASKGTPMPELAVLFTGVLLVAGGALVLLGLWPRVGLACIAVFLLGVTPIMHNFWTVADPQARMGEMINFTKNFALLGGTFMMFAIPLPWAMGLDRRRPATVTAMDEARARRIA
jgi:putative oxidoreductase